MVFSDTSTSDGLVQEARWLVGANSASYPIEDLTRNINRWFDKAVTLIFQSDGRWQWDDKNRTDMPIATTNLVSAQQDYKLNVAHLRVTRVEVKDSAGAWTRLKLIDQNEIQNSLTDFQNVDGNPIYYDLIADTLYLYPAPSGNVTAGLKVYFQRAGSHFATTDTTKEAGFASIFHRYLSLGSAYDYALKNGLSVAKSLREEISVMEEHIQDFYSQKSKDENITLKVTQHNFR